MAPLEPEILKLGNPHLLKKSEPITNFSSQETQDIIQTLLTKKHSLDPIAGLAAPQLGILKRIIIFEAPEHRRDGGEVVPLTIALNPLITWASKETVRRWEACLSFPDLAVEVARPKEVLYAYFTPDGEEITRKATGFHAKVVQHEIDHLDGILSIHRMDDPTRLGYLSEIETFYF